MLGLAVSVTLKKIHWDHTQASILKDNRNMDNFLMLLQVGLGWMVFEGPPYLTETVDQCQVGSGVK